jgi:hypothetical protein
MRSALLLARPTLLLAPLLLPFVVPLALLPPAVAYVVSDARWLVVLGAVCAETSLVLASAGWSMERVRLRVSRLIGALPPRSRAILVWTLAFAGILLLIPGYCFRGDSFGGDEPKYLRLTESLYGDLDVDVASNREAPLTPSRLAANLRTLAASTRKAGVGVWRDEPVPASHVWNRGNWTLAGRAGGLYYLQSPGLPFVLLPGLAVQRLLMPEHGGPHFAMITLAALWATALLQTARLAAEVVGSRTAGLLAALAIAISAPLFVGGYAIYPEAAAAAAVPWLLRHACLATPHTGFLRGASLVLVAGALVWLHPKFLLLSMVLLVALLARLRRPALVVVAILPLLALLLFDHRVTGLLRPDALYLRYSADVYVAGASSFLSLDIIRGLLNALVSARDGLLIIAPVTIAGVLAIPLLAREQRGVALTLAAAFGSLWLAAAIHDGGAPGTPGRLMAPVACVLAVPLALGLLRLERSLEYRWTVALLAILTVLITLTMLSDWRRAVNPYRHMFTPETDFSRDLTPGPLVPEDGPAVVRRGLEIAMRSIPLALVGFWAWICTRLRPTDPQPEARWRAIRNVHLAWWSTLAVGSGLLRALGT